MMAIPIAILPIIFEDNIVNVAIYVTFYVPDGISSGLQYLFPISTDNADELIYQLNQQLPLILEELFRLPACSHDEVDRALNQEYPEVGNTVKIRPV